MPSRSPSRLSPALCLAALSAAASGLTPGAAFARSPSAATLAAVSYAEAGRRPVDAIRVLRDGRVVVDTRTGPQTARLTRDQLGAICPSLYDGSIVVLSQRRLDDEVASLAQQTGLDGVQQSSVCLLTLPTRTGHTTLRLAGSAVLAERFGPRGDLTARFEALRTELERLRQVILLGGVERAEAMASCAAVEYGQAVAIDDLTFGDGFDQTRTAHFQTADGSLVIVQQTATATTVDVFGRVQ